MFKNKKLKLWRIENKKENDDGEFRSQPGFTALGYHEADSYIFVNKHKVISVFDIIIDYGQYNPANIGWVTNLIPQQKISSGQIRIIQRHKAMDKETEDEILHTKLAKYTDNLQNGDLNNKDQKEKRKNNGRAYDYALSGELSKDDNEKIIDTDLRMVVTAKSAEDIEIAMEELRLAYANSDVRGVNMVRLIGSQLDEMAHMFSRVTQDSWHYSDMTSIASGRIFLASSGFSDEHGSYVGIDAHSILNNNPSIIDFSNVNNAVIYTGGNSPLQNSREDGNVFKPKNGGGAWSSIIAEHSSYLKGSRTHYILLDKIDYFAPDSLYFDMDKEAINPLEVFGTEKTVMRDNNANVDKLIEMVMMLVGINKNVEEYSYMRNELNTQYVKWFVETANGSGMYSTDPQKNPLDANRSLATKYHDAYPKMNDFSDALTAAVNDASNGNERALDRMTNLQKTLKTTISRYPNVFKRTTTLPDVYSANDRNIYYDLSRFKDNKVVLGAIFLNIIAYVTNRALENEEIVVVGLDNIDVDESILNVYRERITDKNIGLITTFEQKSSINKLKKYKGFTGDLISQDLVLLGSLNTGDEKIIEELWSGRSLPEVALVDLLGGQEGRFFISRRDDGISAIVDSNIIL